MLAPFFRKKDQNGPDRATPYIRLAEESVAEPAARAAEDPVEAQPQRTSAASPARLDKLSLDLLGVAEQMIQAKQMAEQKIMELEDRLHQAGGHIDRLTRDIRSLDQMVGERDQSITELEQRLAGKNLKVDQVLEDYRELQRGMSAELESLKGLLEMEQQKYRTLLQKHSDAQTEKTKKINELEERISKLEIENGQLKTRMETQRQEKAYLDRMISDFTSRMASPFGQGGQQRPEGNGDQ